FGSRPGVSTAFQRRMLLAGAEFYRCAPRTEWRCARIPAEYIKILRVIYSSVYKSKIQNAGATMPVKNSILDCIGRTPLVRLDRIRGGANVDLLGKVEMMNPGGSVKDRIGLAMVQSALKSGALKPGDTMVE